MTSPAEHAAKKKALETTLGQIDKKFGRGAIMTFDADALPNIEVYSTGSIALDSALGVGGVARGRIVEIFGPESSGKTTVCLQTAAAAQAAGFLVAFIDAEHALDPKYAQALGVNIDEMLISQPDCGEDALEIADMLVRSGAVGLVIVDSVAALTPRAELEGEMGDASVGLQARMMSKAMRKIAGQAKQTSTTLLFTNQIREKVGVMFGSPETQPGGRALKFFASQRMDIRRKETIKDGTEAVANRVKVKVVKNKVAPPFRESEFEIQFGAGVNQNQEIIDLGVEHNLVTKSGSFYSVGDMRIGQGKQNSCRFLADPENAELRADLLAKVRAAVGLNPPATASTPDSTPES